MTKKTGSRIGNKKGYTLFELLVTIAVLSIGLVYLFPAFFKSGNGLSYIAHRYEAKIAVQNLLVNVEEYKQNNTPFDKWEKRGLVSSGDRDFPYELSIRPIFVYRHPKLGQDRSVFQIRAKVSWTGGQLSRTTYVVH